MGKTIFHTGDTLLPAYMDSIYGQGIAGGHRHDGQDLDGHAAKIDLTTDVQGLLNSGNVEAIPVDTGITGLLIQSQVTGMQYDQSWCIGVTGANSGTYNGMGVSGVQRVYDGKNFQNLIVSNPVSQTESQAVITAKRGLTSNIVSFKPTPSKTGGVTLINYVTTSAGGWEILEGFIPLDSYLNDVFRIDLLIYFSGISTPWKLEGIFSKNIINALPLHSPASDHRAYCVPYNYTAGIASAQPGFNDANQGYNFYLSTVGGSFYLWNNQSLAVKVSGQIIHPGSVF